MELGTKKNDLLRNYLLGEMSDETRQKIEENFLGDDQIFEEINALEDELYYDYHQNRLTSAERTIFEQKFLRSHEDIEKLVFAKAFLETTGEFAQQKTAAKAEIESVSWLKSIAAFFNFSGSTMQFGMAAALLIIVLGVIGLFIQNSRLQNEMAGLQQKQAQEKLDQENNLADKQRQQTEIEQQLANEKSQGERNEKRIQEIEAERTKLENEINETRRHINQIPQNPVQQKTQVSQPQLSLAAIILAPGLFNREGGTGMTKVNLAPSVKNLQFRLLLNSKDEYEAYDVIVKSVDNQRVVWTDSQLKPLGKAAKKSLSLNIPTKNLQRADYEISIIGITANGEGEEVNSYYFSALK